MKIARIVECVSVCCVAASLFACSSDKKTTPGGADAGSGGATGSGGASGTGGGSSSGGGTSKGGSDGGGADAGATSVTGTVADLSNGDATRNFDYTKYPAVSGMKVCVYGDASIPCVMTDANGKYTITGVPVGTQFYLSYEKDTYRPTLFATSVAKPGAFNVVTMLVTTEAYSETFASQGGVTNDTSAGTIIFGATELGPASTPFHEMFGTTEIFYLEGYTVSISPAAKAGPVFTSATWTADATLTKSSAAGWGFFQAAPGDYTLTFTKPGYNCPVTKTMVVKGFTTTYVGSLCTKIAGDGGAPDAGKGDGGH
jgi:hypothetical protein